MNAQYDGMAEAYQRTKASPLRQYVEAYSFMNCVGDVSGMRVLDLACGDGFYARALRAAGAAQVTAVDISADMIALARSAEAATPLGIEYVCADVGTLDALGEFDLVTAAYLLHYAPTRAELQTMCAAIARQLVPGGRLVSINENPDQPGADYPAYTQYGFNKQFALPREAGSAIHYSMVSGRELVRFTAHYYSRHDYEHALRKAGFEALQWRQLGCDPDVPAAIGPAYFRPYLDNPPVLLLDCRL